MKASAAEAAEAAEADATRAETRRVRIIFFLRLRLRSTRFPSESVAGPEDAVTSKGCELADRSRLVC